MATAVGNQDGPGRVESTKLFYFLAGRVGPGPDPERDLSDRVGSQKWTRGQQKV